MGRASARTAICVAFALAAVGIITHNLWAGFPFTWSAVSVALISGIALGSIYALAASGIVVTYTSTGIFNFAQGAMGMLLAFVYWTLRVEHGWPTPLALVVVVVVAAPALGIAVERLLMRHLVNASIVVQLVATIALMAFLMGIASTFWDTSEARTTDFFFGLDGFKIGDAIVPWHRAIAIGVAIALAVGLRFVLYHTRLGVTMRAVVDNRPLAALHGVAPSRVAMTAWALSTACAALAAILLAPEVTVAVQPLTLITISAFAAAIVGRLRSLPMTFLGAMVLGIVTVFAQSFLDMSGRWAQLPDALPSIFLLVALLALPMSRLEYAKVSGRVQRGPDHIASFKQSVVSAIGVFVVIAIASGALDRENNSRLTLGIATAVIMLSFIPLTGWSGQVSLAQLTLAGIGAFTMWKVGGAHGNLIGLVAAALVALPFGLLMALPALRLHGLYLALSTLAFALLGEYLLFAQTEVFGAAGRQIERPVVLGIDLADQRTMLLFVTVIFGLMAIGVTGVRRGRMGRRLIALRDSEAASVTFGVNLIVTKLAVFALSAAMAGFGGALLLLQRTSGTATDFTWLTGLPLLLLVVVGGVESPGGALFGGLMSVALIMVQGWWHISMLDAIQVLGPGLLALGVAQNPDGVVVLFSRALAPRLPRRRPPAVPSPAETDHASAAADRAVADG